MARTSFKIVLVGDGEVGKSAWVSSIMGGTYSNGYAPTLGVEVHPVNYNTTSGPITFNIWDCAGVERFGGLRDGYYVMADGAILMCDLTDRVSIDSLTKWHRDIVRWVPDAPIVVCGNKLESSDCVCAVVEERRDSIDFCSISVSGDQNIHQPLLLLARRLTGDPILEFI